MTEFLSEENIKSTVNILLKKNENNNNLQISIESENTIIKNIKIKLKDNSLNLKIKLKDFLIDDNYENYNNFDDINILENISEENISEENISEENSLITIQEYLTYTTLLSLTNINPENLNSEICKICNNNLIYHGDILLCQIKKCNHIYHATCLREWFQNSKLCPECNIDITS